jgi:ubiquinone/menaquinone biosynthesis C-methylase UbiE
LNNVQTFSQSSGQYAKNRPQYPDELFSYLSKVCSARDSAWDCATGNGQAAVSLARYFSHVEATDISAEQIEHGIPHPRVRYSLSPAEQTPFEKEAFDLVVVATAVHWFDQGQFFREVDRVLKPGGVLAIWGYGTMTITPEVDQVLAGELLAPIDHFWSEGNRQVMNGYRDLSLPFEEIRDPPELSVRVEWDLAQLLAFMRTWSAVKRFASELGVDPMDGLDTKLKPVWGNLSKTKIVQLPLPLRVSQKSD